MPLGSPGLLCIHTQHKSKNHSDFDLIMTCASVSRHTQQSLAVRHHGHHQNPKPQTPEKDTEIHKYTIQ